MTKASQSVLARLLTITKSLEAQVKPAGEAAGHLIAIGVFTTGLILTWTHWATGDYLAAFGLLGVSALGDTTGFLSAILPTIIRVTLALAGLAIFPVLASIVSETQRHAFRGAFGWLSPDSRRNSVKARRLFMLHLPAIACALALMISFFVQATGPIGPVFFAALILLASGVSFGWVRRCAERMTTKARKIYESRSLAIAFYANIALIVWLVLTADLVLDGLRAPLTSLPQTASSLAACGVVLALLAAYLLLSIPPRPTALAIILCIAALQIVYWDNRPMVGAILRAARLGGGLVQPYYSPGAKADTPPQRVCLILAIGETRIVWTPDEDTAKTDAPCASPAFRAHFERQRPGGGQDPFQTMTGVRALKPEDFMRPPAAPAKAPDPT